MRVIDSRANPASQYARTGEHAKDGRLTDADWRDPELAWLTLWLVCVVAIAIVPKWQVIPIDALWISLAVLYGLRMWPSKRALALLAIALVTTAGAIGADLLRHVQLDESVEQMPFLAVIFAAMAWQANRRIAARDRATIATDAEQLLATQRRFLQDASHQLRTPITIALGHAELLEQALAGQQRRDIGVVVGELDRLKALSEQLLLVATSEIPDFLARQLADLDLVAADLLCRWRPVASRHWRLGQLDPVTALVDTHRLGLALDALVENGVRHTGQDDEIEVCVISPDDAGFARIVVRDSGEGIAAADLPFIFDRFRTVAGTARGTGLGLALVQAVARGHGGEVRARSSLGRGSTFELLLPAAAPAGNGAAADRDDLEAAQPGQLRRDG